MQLHLRVFGSLIVLLMSAAACSGGEESTTVVGVVTDVEGDLTTVTAFVIRQNDGTDIRFLPADGILFHDSAPMSHIRDHLRSAEPVTVTYRRGENGTLVAIRVTD